MKYVLIKLEKKLITNKGLGSCDRNLEATVARKAIGMKWEETWKQMLNPLYTIILNPMLLHLPVSIFIFISFFPWPNNMIFHPRSNFRTKHFNLKKDH